MSTHGTHPVESFVHETGLSDDSSTPRATTPDEPPYVLEAIEEDDALRERPTVVVCPGCTTEIASYPTGLPERIIHFREDCPDCDVELRRWSAVALPASLLRHITPETLAKITQAYWDRRLWAGITTSGYPRTQEFTDAFDKRAVAYGWDWTPRCPLCRRPVDELAADRLDYHHWTKVPDRGVCLCRQCHDAISAGQYDEDLDWQARQLGLGGKHHLQVARLAVRETLVQSYNDVAALARTLVERYNVPFTPTHTTRILEQAFQADEVCAALADDTLQAGVTENR